MKAGDLLFVYGTLRCGERNSLQGHRSVLYIGQDRINGVMYHLGWYPGITFDPGPFDAAKPVIIGDLFRIKDASIIAHLDAYEGYPDLYGREKTGSRRGRKVWAYFFKGDLEGKEPLKVGDWKVSQKAIQVGGSGNEAVA